ncbi:hypothetical protein KBB42_01300 [Candidatus Dojkabacteria bacterium]|nr:hypothetical protein [Candidatus Dojkabacteria bacterium]
MGLITTKASKKREEELAQIAEKSKKGKLGFGDLIIPIASGTLFIILSFAVFVPMVKSAFEYLDEIKVTKEKIEQLEKVNKEVAKLDEDQLNEDVVTARKVIPKKLLVSDLVSYLNELATSLELSISELSSGDALNAVSGPIGYSGAYDNVIKFLDDAQNVSPYMLRLQNVEISAVQTEVGEVWNISLDISGYYIAEEDEEPSIYAPFKSYMEYEDIVQVFKDKAKSLD